MAPDSPERVEEILDRLEDVGEEADCITIGDMTRALGERSHGPFLLIPSLLDISPLGAIPGVPTALAAILLLFAVQVVIGRRHLWLPAFIRNVRLSSERLQKAVETLRPVGRWMDRWFHGRLTVLTKDPFMRASGLACVAMALLVPPLEIIPFGTTLSTATIAMFGLALLFRDGLLMIAGFAMTIAAVSGIFWLFTG